jgi:hypothetical protein
MTFDQRSPKKCFCLAGQPSPPRRYHHSAREPDRGLLMAATQSFFRNQARTHSAALQTLREIAADDFGERVPPFARSKRPGRSHERARLGQSDHLPPAPVVEHFTIRFLAQPPKQIGSGKETIGNYLQAFVIPEIAQVFCPGANTFASPTSTPERLSTCLCRKDSRWSAATRTRS